MSKYDLAIFDLDGTILYTLEDLKNSLNYALARHGFPERTLEEVRRFVGNGVRMLVQRGARRARTRRNWTGSMRRSTSITTCTIWIPPGPTRGCRN